MLNRSNHNLIKAERFLYFCCKDGAGEIIKMKNEKDSTCHYRGDHIEDIRKNARVLVLINTEMGTSVLYLCPTYIYKYLDVVNTLNELKIK